jgi:2-oxoglutarate ferredoxin oxidoreductase subunit beta
MHDGSRLFLKKLDSNYDATDKSRALAMLRENGHRQEFATGILYIEPAKYDFTTMLNMVDEPLSTLPLERVRPGREVLDAVMESLK